MSQNLKAIDDTGLISNLNTLTTGSVLLSNSVNGGTGGNGINSITGGLDLNTNTGSGIATNSWYVPTTTLAYSYWYPTLPVPTVSIDKVENGFIITKDNKRFVAKKAEEILKYLKGEEK